MEGGVREWKGARFQNNIMKIGHEEKKIASHSNSNNSSSHSSNRSIKKIIKKKKTREEKYYLDEYEAEKKTVKIKKNKTPKNFNRTRI